MALTPLLLTGCDFERMIIAIDGPSGAGKSTLGRMLARELNLLYIDTGAMYRAVALAVIEQGTSPTDQVAVADVARRAQIELAGDPNSLQVKLNGRDVTTAIRSKEVGSVASMISTISEVRRELVRRQREMGAQGGGVVLDGRDIGTIVFPNADIKFFLTATPEQRAHRRYEEDRTRINASSLEATFADINERDARDSTRADSPLVIADDAIVIDSTELPIDQVFERVVTAVRERQAREIS